jgi:hypothetical protein
MKKLLCIVFTFCLFFVCCISCDDAAAYEKNKKYKIKDKINHQDNQCSNPTEEKNGGNYLNNSSESSTKSSEENKCTDHDQLEKNDDLQSKSDSTLIVKPSIKVEIPVAFISANGGDAIPFTKHKFFIEYRLISLNINNGEKVKTMELGCDAKYFLYDEKWFKENKINILNVRYDNSGPTAECFYKFNTKDIVYGMAPTKLKSHN